MIVDSAGQSAKAQNLLAQMRGVLRLQRYAIRTKRAYWIKGFIQFHRGKFEVLSGQGSSGQGSSRSGAHGVSRPTWVEAARADARPTGGGASPAKANSATHSQSLSPIEVERGEGHRSASVPTKGESKVQGARWTFEGLTTGGVVRTAGVWWFWFGVGLQRWRDGFWGNGLGSGAGMSGYLGVMLVCLVTEQYYKGANQYCLGAVSGFLLWFVAVSATKNLVLGLKNLDRGGNKFVW